MKTFSNKQQKQIEQALVYLKLRQMNCPKRTAIIFTQKSNRKKFFKIDGTVSKDGPPNYRQLHPINTKQNLINGWLINNKLNYKQTVCNVKRLEQEQTVQRKRLMNIINKQRYEQKRIAQSEQALNKKYQMFNKQKQQFKQNILLLKEQLFNQKEFKEKYIKFQNTKLHQSTNNFFKQWQKVDTDNLIYQLGAFDNFLINYDMQTVNDRKKNLRSPKRSPKNKIQKTDLSPPPSPLLMFNSKVLQPSNFDYNDVKQKQKQIQTFRKSLKKLKKNNSETKTSLLLKPYSINDKQFQENLELTITKLRQKTLTSTNKNQNKYQNINKMKDKFRIQSTKLKNLTNI